ncbi:MAG: sugar phosphate isomerase/epimerase [Phycisphaerae bacterium]|nr:sugar phosphate isomerase/epimerase [Phycisphaerae bacterium]
MIETGTEFESQAGDLVRRDFLKTAGAGLISSVALISALSSNLEGQEARAAGSRDRLIKRIASNSYAVNQLFKRRSRSTRQTTSELKAKYGEITMLDFPQFTKDTYAGVTAMDLWSSLFGDVQDDSQFVSQEAGGRIRLLGFDPSTPSSKRYLDRLAANMASTGVTAKHVSNNVPRNLADLDETKRQEGIRVAKIWLDACQQIGVASMRVNTGGPSILPPSEIKGGYPQNTDIVPYLKSAIESFKVLAGYGEKRGVKVTIENHWGLAAEPMNVRIILNEVNSPYCEASPDFCNWEHEYMLYHGLEALIPYASSMVHAKRWSRYPEVDIARCVRVLNKANYSGYISLEYEAGGDPVEGTLQLMKDVLAVLV